MLLAVPAWGQSKADKQKEVKKASSETLAQLYKSQRSAKKVTANAAGYATFSNFGMKILWPEAAAMAVDNKTKKFTSMKRLEVQAGLGLGVKKFRQAQAGKGSRGRRTAPRPPIASPSC